MKINIILILLFATACCQAQTKLIAHKSHSGSRHSFSKAYQNNLFDMDRSNFGLPGSRNLVVLDSVIVVNDSITIVKTRETISCYRFDMKYKELKASDFKSKTDTIVNPEFLFENNRVALMKTNGENKHPFWFANPEEEVVFISPKQ